MLARDRDQFRAGGNGHLRKHQAHAVDWIANCPVPSFRPRAQSMCAAAAGGCSISPSKSVWPSILRARSRDDAAEVLSFFNALELLGVGIALMLDQGELAHSCIGLPQRKALPLCQPDQDLARPVQKPRTNAHRTRTFGTCQENLRFRNRCTCDKRRKCLRHSAVGPRGGVVTQRSAKTVFTVLTVTDRP
jgi:hypothetical protein